MASEYDKAYLEGYKEGWIKALQEARKTYQKGTKNKYCFCCYLLNLQGISGQFDEFIEDKLKESEATECQEN